MARLLAEAEKAKRPFNDQPSVPLRLPAPDGNLDQATPVTVSRADWQARVAPLVARLRYPMLKVLRDAGLTPDHLGGSSSLAASSGCFSSPIY